MLTQMQILKTHNSGATSAQIQYLLSIVKIFKQDGTEKDVNTGIPWIDYYYFSYTLIQASSSKFLIFYDQRSTSLSISDSSIQNLRSWRTIKITILNYFPTSSPQVLILQKDTCYGTHTIEDMKHELFGISLFLSISLCPSANGFSVLQHWTQRYNHVK